MPMRPCLFATERWRLQEEHAKLTHGTDIILPRVAHANRVEHRSSKLIPELLVAVRWPAARLLVHVIAELQLGSAGSMLCQLVPAGAHLGSSWIPVLC